MKKYFLALVLLTSIICSSVVYSKPAVSCLVSCNKLFISFDQFTYNIEGLGDLNCGNSNQFCEFYTLLSVWYYDNNNVLTYWTSSCNGWVMECGVKNYPILSSSFRLDPGYKYVVYFSVYDVNKGCGTCNNPILCNATCSTSKVIDLR